MFFFRMDFSSKLTALKVAQGAERVEMKSLTDKKGYKIMAARKHVHKKYGASIIIDVLVDDVQKVTFLPKRFAKELTDEDINRLDSGDFMIRCVGFTNRSPEVEIAKAFE